MKNENFKNSPKARRKNLIMGKQVKMLKERWLRLGSHTLKHILRQKGGWGCEKTSSF